MAGLRWYDLINCVLLMLIILKILIDKPVLLASPDWRGTAGGAISNGRMSEHCRQIIPLLTGLAELGQIANCHDVGCCD